MSGSTIRVEIQANAQPPLANLTRGGFTFNPNNKRQGSSQARTLTEHHCDRKAADWNRMRKHNKICSKCNSKITEEALFCPECGNRLDSKTDQEPIKRNEESDNPSKKAANPLRKTIKHSLKLSHRTVRMISLVTLVLVLGSSIAYAVFRAHQNTYPQSQQSETASTYAKKDPETNYQITDRTLKVSVPNTEANGKRETAIWHYDELTCTDANKATTAINAIVKKTITKTAKNTESQNKELVDCTLRREIKITHITDDYVCYADCQDLTNGGTVTRIRNGVYFDLKTGKSVKPSTAIGESTEELTKKSRKAIKAYLKGNPVYSDDQSLNEEIVEDAKVDSYKGDLGLESSLLLTNKGVVWVSSTAMLRYSSEIAHIVVEPRTNDLSVGDNIEKIPPLYLTPYENSEK